MPNQKVIVTGAGSGIGREFTKLFLADGSDVLAVSLQQSELDKLKADLEQRGQRMMLLQMDLSEVDAAQRLFAWCEQHDWIPDILVNNAGFACYGDTVDLDPDKLTRMLALNVVTLTQTSMLFGRVMRQRRHGKILNVGSTAGMMPSTRMASYCATKAYVNSFSFALAAELESHGVTVTCLTPGATQTNFSKSSDIETYRGKSILADMFRAGKASLPSEVAEAGYRGLLAGQRHVLAGKGSRLASLASRLVAQSRIPGMIPNL